MWRHYYWLVIRRALAGSLDWAQAIVFVCLIAVGLLLAVFPHLQRGQAIFDTIVSWKGIGWALGTVVVTRLLVSPYYLWKEATDQNRELRDQNKELTDQSKELKDELAPKIECSFDLTDTLCLASVSLDWVSLWLRMRVTVIGVGTLEHCSGRSVSVKKPDGEVAPLELRLPFAPHEKNGLGPIKLIAGQPEYLDVIYFTDQNQVKLVTLLPASVDQDEMFKQEGLYEITVRVASEASRPKDARLTFYKHKDFVTTRSQFIRNRA